MKTWQTTSGCTIRQVLGDRFNVFLVETGTQSILIDTGLRICFHRLKKNLMRSGIRLGIAHPGTRSLDYLLLTHTHFDHCQNAASLKKLTGCTVVISRQAAASVNLGYTTIPCGTNPYTRWLSRAGRNLKLNALTYRPFNGDILVDDFHNLPDQVADLKIVSTPGHSADSISLLIDREIAIVGDTLFGMGRNDVFPPFADDVPRMVKTWEALLSTPCTLFLPGHGHSVTRELLESRKRHVVLRIEE